MIEAVVVEAVSAEAGAVPGEVDPVTGAVLEHVVEDVASLVVLLVVGHKSKSETFCLPS